MNMTTSRPISVPNPNREAILDFLVTDHARQRRVVAVARQIRVIAQPVEPETLEPSCTSDAWYLDCRWAMCSAPGLCHSECRRDGASRYADSDGSTDNSEVKDSLKVSD